MRTNLSIAQLPALRSNANQIRNYKKDIMHCIFTLVLISSCVFGLAVGDAVHQALADFTQESLKQWAVQAPVLIVPDSAPVSIPEEGIVPISGWLSNIELKGIDENTTIWSGGNSIESGTIQYRIAIENAVMTGNYNLSGSLASAISLVGSGRWEMKMKHPIELVCEVILELDDGYIKQALCMVQRYNFDVKESTIIFSGLIPAPLDPHPKLIQEINQNILNSATGAGGISLTIRRILAQATMGHLQKDYDTTRLVEMVPKNSGVMPYRPMPITHFAYNESPIYGRISDFTVKTLENLAFDHIDLDGHVTVGLTYMFLPLSGTLTNIKFSGFSDFSNITANMFAYENLLTLTAKLTMRNVTFTGAYDLYGSVAGNVPIQGQGNWSISTIGSCGIEISGNWKNSNGSLIWVKDNRGYFECQERQIFVAKFPGLFDSANLAPAVQQVAIDILAKRIGQSFNDLVSSNLNNKAVAHLRNVFNAVPIIDILTA